jgi:hypothetical protein
VRLAVAALAVLACAAPTRTETPNSGASFAGISRQTVGEGAYLARLPDGEKGPSNKGGLPVAPKVVADWSGRRPPTTGGRR